MSLRLRLTLWYISLLAVILIAFSGALYAILTFSLFNEVDRTLQTRAAEVQNGATAAFELQTDSPPFFLRGRFRIPPANSFATPGVFVQVATTDGTAVSISENLGNQHLTISSDLVARVVRGESLLVNLNVDNVPLRAFVSPLSLRNQIIGVIVVAQSLQNANDTLARLATLLAIGILAGLLLAAVIGALIARRALAPIDHITQTARDISRAGDLARRIETKQTRDEVGRLAGTFNEMLTRIEELF
ncbi:MAG: HAMP domain-containing protein, partial [Chloroflexi bacterium]|nr:HAMP domain-containing protein [Chloroflexota bacterium]